MLEKIGLPPKPSLRGTNWVVDASHCQGCSSQFNFINRKHHCRRCGGLFCNSCTQLRMVLRGQGDSPVRICESCKKLEEATRFEMRYGHKNRASRGGSKLTSRTEDEILNQILGNDGKDLVSSGQGSSHDMVSSSQRTTSSTSSSNFQESTNQDEGGGNFFVEETSHVSPEKGTSSPEELRQQALDEKKKYKVLKAEGKSEEALKAFKRGKELERQAGALELMLRKNRRLASSSSNMTETYKIKDDVKVSDRTSKVSPQMSKEKDDLAAELRELGWSDMDLRDAEKKPASLTLEGELSSLLGELSQKNKAGKGAGGIEKTQIIAHKKKALELKREGKLSEAKEELKRAKVLERQLEEQEFLADAEDSDDELSSLIRSMDVDKQDDLSVGYETGPGFNFDHIGGLGDDLGVNSNFDVTDEDMDDPEMTAALRSLGWSEEANSSEDVEPQFVRPDREMLSHEIQSLKRDAVNQKRAGNTGEALALLKKAKVLEKDYENYDPRGTDLLEHNSKSAGNPLNSKPADVGDASGKKEMDPKLALKSKRVVQKELLELKKRALALRREGRVEEADEELKKGKILEQQLEEIESASKMKATPVNIDGKSSGNSPSSGPGDDGDVTDQDMRDPTYISLLRNLGWEDDDDGSVEIPSKSTKRNESLSAQSSDVSVAPVPASVKVESTRRRSKGEIQRELLGLKRKALTLRRQGQIEEAEGVLRAASALEAQLAEIDEPKKVPTEINQHLGNGSASSRLNTAVDEGEEGPVSEEEMHDPSLLSMLNNLGWKDEVETVSGHEKSSKQMGGNFVYSETQVVASTRSKRDIQKELLDLRRKALKLRRQGETEEAEEVLRKAKVLESLMEDVEAPNKDLQSDAPDHKEFETGGISITDAKHKSLKGVVEVNEGSAQTVSDFKGKLVESPIDSDKLPFPKRSEVLITGTFQATENKHPALIDLGPEDELKTTKAAGGLIPSSGQSANLMDLLIGDYWSNPQTSSVSNLEDKRSSSPGMSSCADFPVKLDLEKSSKKDFGIKENTVHVKTEEKIHVNERLPIDESNSGHVSASQNDQSSVRQDILTHKRKALALKREGKLVEAREELRQAKLLEKNLGDDKSQPNTASGSNNISGSTSNVVAPVGQPEHIPSNVAPKPLSSRDRFKLQQESLSHKRLALKLRREGRTEEADAEFELAKALEIQLEGSSTGSDSLVSGAEATDDVSIESFLDPQLLSALKAIGIQDTTTIASQDTTTIASQVPFRPEPAKPTVSKSESSSQERIQLEERIKAEKVKAVQLKRSGKQAEAMDALRRSKVLEKKLNSLT